jgi:N-acetyl-anhydromuramyl-L-alanine amidase AmpD
MKIQKNPNIKFKCALSKRPYTRRIVIHHSASHFSTTIEDIQAWHYANGWSGVGYHFVIHADGSIWEGRPIETQGAHAYQDKDHEANTDGIGICLAGNFMTAIPTEAQMASLVWLIQDIWKIYLGIGVIGHKDVMATACPGDKFPWDDLRKRLEGGNNMAEQWKEKIIDNALKAGLITERHDPDEPASKWFVLAVVLNASKGVLK